MKLWPVEQRAIAPPEDIEAAEWANANIRLLPQSSREPGPYRWQRTPYSRSILNLYQRPELRHLVLKWGTQLGKTQDLYLLLGYIVDQDPYPTMLAYPTDDTGKEISRVRVQPMVDASETLRSLKPNDPKKYQLTEMHFPGMVLYIVGANSPTPLNQKPCRNLLRDEVNDWPPVIKDQGDPMDISEDRLKGFWDIRKVIDVSSPTTPAGNITKQEKKCQVVLKYFIPCPHCRRLQPLAWEQIKFENDKKLPNTERIQKAKNTAVYICRFCGEGIDDEGKEWFLSEENGAGWFDMRMEGPQPSPDPIGDLFDRYAARGIVLESVAARLSSLYSPWLRWADIVQKFLEAHLAEFNRPDSLRKFFNGWLAREWKDVIETKSESAVLSLRCEIPPLIVPEKALALVCGIDQQKYGFYYVVRAWAADYTNWLIRYGELITFDDVFKLVYEDTYQVESGGRMGIWRAGLDTGGGDGREDRTMTQAAYEWLLKFGGQTVFGTRGGSRKQPERLRYSQVPIIPGAKRGTVPHVPLWIMDTGYYKDLFHSRMQLEIGSPGAVYLHAETSEAYAKQITAEEKVRQKNGLYKWENPHQRDNHYFDCEVINLAMVDPMCYGGLMLLTEPVQTAVEEPPKPRREPTPERPANWMHGGREGGFDRPSWLNR